MYNMNSFIDTLLAKDTKIRMRNNKQAYGLRFDRDFGRTLYTPINVDNTDFFIRATVHKVADDTRIMGIREFLFYPINQMYFTLYAESANLINGKSVRVDLGKRQFYGYSLSTFGDIDLSIDVIPVEENNTK